MPTVQTRKLSDGAVRFFVRLRDPRRGKATSEVFATRREAEQFCKLVAAVGPAEAIAKRDQRQGEGSPTTVDDLIEPFLEWKTKGPRKVRSDRTIADYRRDYTNWIKPTFGPMQADAVTEDDVRRWVDALASGALGKVPSAKSVGDRHSILFGLYAWAVRDKRVPTNPCIGTDLPRRRKTAPKALRPAEWKALHIALRQIHPDAADLAVFLAWTGWRFSEATALSAFDVEDYGDELWVTMGQVVRRNAAGQHVIVEDAKSDAGQRRIRMLAESVDVIRRRMDTVVGNGLVFTTKGGAQWHHSNFLNRAWKQAVETAGLTRNPTPHWLRHSHVVWLSMTHEVSLAEIQKRIGHEHISTTIGVYGSMISDVSPAALAALDKMIGSGPPLPELTD